MLDREMKYIYVNGRYQSAHEALVSVNDRGYQFGDGLYDVVALKAAHFVDFKRHRTRFQQGLLTLGIEVPYLESILKTVAHELLRREPMNEGLLYVQATRGVAPRLHTFPTPPTKPSLVMYLKEQPTLCPGIMIDVIVRDDWRSGFSSLKTTALLPNILARQAALEQGAHETFFVKDGLVREAASCNIFMVKEGAYHTPPSDGHIVPGVTRARMIELLRDAGLPLHERAIHLDEVLAADEVFVVHTSNGLRGVRSVNGQLIADGQMGALTRDLFKRYGLFALTEEAQS